jgi:hypothetical protein
MCDMGIYFEPPSVASKRAWAIMELLSRNGYRFPTEGSKAFIYTFILITNRPTLEGVRRRVDVLRWQQEENRMKTRLKGYKEERKRWQCLARKWTQMRTWIGIVLTRFIYSLITSICLCTIGFFYRCRLYPLRFRRFITQLYNLITAILAVLGIGVVAIKTDYWNDIHKFLSDRLTAAISVWRTIPPVLQVIGEWLLIIAALIIAYFIIRRLKSKEHLLRIATRRLHDGVPQARRQLSANPEAELLIKRLESGRKNQLAYGFLCDLWEPYLEGAQALSLLTISIQGRLPMRIPVVTLSLPSSTDGSDASLEPLLRSLRVKPTHRFPDLRRTQPSPYSQPALSTERLEPRTPLPRYLTRYGGPTKEQTHFADDYAGYNVCLYSVSLNDDKVNLPIDCTLELYGNIIDSCDIFIDELYMHFSLPQPQRQPSPEHVLRQLPWRYKLHKAHRGNPLEILTKPHNRAAGFGVSALTVFNREGEFVAMRGLRSTAVGTYRETYHVIPAGMTNVDPYDEESNVELLSDGYLNVKLLLEKEFLEEAFSSLGWPAHCEVSPDRWPRLVRDYALEHLYGGDSNNYGAEIHLTGIVVDLLNYRPEVCALILIRSADWWDQHRPHRVSGGTVNWSLSYEWDKHVKPVAVLDETACAEAMPLNRSVMSGVAAFHLGIQKARDLIGRSK